VIVFVEVKLVGSAGAATGAIVCSEQAACIGSGSEDIELLRLKDCVAATRLGIALTDSVLGAGTWISRGPSINARDEAATESSCSVTLTSVWTVEAYS